MIDPYVPHRGNVGYDVHQYDIELDYSINSNHLDGRARLGIVAVERLERFSLDLVRLRVSKVVVAGRAARWQHRNGKIHVIPVRPIPAGKEVAVDVHYSGNPKPVLSPWGPIGWEELVDGVLVAAQPTGASSWFPCNDIARQKASFMMAVTAASSYRVVANGALRSRRTRGSTTTWTYEQREPTSPYLIALHVGRYEEHLVVDRPVPIRAYLAAQHRSAFDDAFAGLPKMMDMFVELFGPYPLDTGYSVIICPEPLDIPVEAQGQATFGTNHLGGRHERLIAHELAHQWFGNSLTAETWQNIWLHEGFACYAEWLWSEGSGGRSADAHAREHHARLMRMRKDLVLADPGPADMFDDRVYKRGALALHALRLAIGDEMFFDLVRTWTAANRHSVVTTEAFEALAAEVAGESVCDQLRPWLWATALPDLTRAA